VLRQLALLPHLECDLETLAEDEALLSLENRDDPGWVAAFLEHPVEEQSETLYTLARQRWHQKVCAAGRLIAEQGWEEALHCKSLQVMGYSRNADVMLETAKAFPLRLLRRGEVSPDAIYDHQAGRWKLAGIRPANHPRTRLRAYLELLEMEPDWPDIVFSWAEVLGQFRKSGGRETTRQVRRLCGLSDTVRTLKDGILRNRPGGTRLYTWLADALLPHYSAETGQDLFPIWFHGYPGDMPGSVWALVKASPLSSELDYSHANGWLQGALALGIEQETGYRQLDFTDLPEGWG
jgi:hypothetical protein